VHLLVNEQCEYQNERCNDKNYLNMFILTPTKELKKRNEVCRDCGVVQEFNITYGI